jgi:hypothetical protein
MPAIHYIRCVRPLVAEADRLARIVREERLDYCIFDSVAFAVDGPPEAAESASRYFQALRQIGTIGSLHIAHVAKGESGDQRPFGSAFWFNGCRGCWYIRRAESMPDSERVAIALYARKANLGPLRPPVGFEIDFTEDRTTFRRVDVADNPELASGLSVRQRMAAALRHGAMDAKDLAADIQATSETVSRVVRRYRQQFTVLPGGKVGLLQVGS